MSGIRGTLAAVVLSSAIGSSGCNFNPEYDYVGNIGGDQVKFSSHILSGNFLKIIKPDGIQIKYYAGADLQVDTVYINVDRGNTTGYTYRYSRSSSNETVKKVITDAQERFDSYLTKIIEIKTKSLRE